MTGYKYNRHTIAPQDVSEMGEFLAQRGNALCTDLACPSKPSSMVAHLQQVQSATWPASISSTVDPVKTTRRQLAK